MAKSPPKVRLCACPACQAPDPPVGHCFVCDQQRLIARCRCGGHVPAAYKQSLVATSCATRHASMRRVPTYDSLTPDLPDA